MNRGFKGVWIPAEIWLADDLNCTERCFLAEIDSLDKGRGCWAGNGHFSEFSGLSKNRCSELIKDLERKDYISINRDASDGSTRRILRMVTPFGISNPPSESRQDPSESRTPLYKVLIIQLEIQERDARAIFFLAKEDTAELERFFMQNQKQFTDFKKFIMDFCDTVEQERLEYDVPVLRARLRKYSRNYLQRQRKNPLTELDKNRTVTQIIGNRL